MGDGPHIFTVPAHQSMVEVLAQGLMDRYGPDSGHGDPLAMGRVQLFLPTRRAARTLREAFLRLSNGQALLLPRILPLGAVDDEESLTTGLIARDEEITVAVGKA